MKKIGLVLSISLLGAGCVAQTPAVPDEAASMQEPMMEQYESVVSDLVEENDVRGMYYRPSEYDGQLPGVLVIHEWWGLNDQIKNEAQMLANEGYAVFAIDLYEGKVTADPGEAGVLANIVRNRPDVAERKMKAALDYLESRPEVASDRLASLGWCFGGGMSGIIGSSGDSRLRGTIIYYGTPVTDPARLANMTQPVLGIWGADDTSIPVSSVNDYESALKSQGTDVSFQIYEGAGHAFANPTRGDAYRPEATEDAWGRVLSFLQAHLKQ